MSSFSSGELPGHHGHSPVQGDEDRQERLHLQPGTLRPPAGRHHPPHRPGRDDQVLDPPGQ